MYQPFTWQTGRKQEQAKKEEVSNNFFSKLNKTQGWKKSRLWNFLRLRNKRTKKVVICDNVHPNSWQTSHFFPKDCKNKRQIKNREWCKPIKNLPFGREFRTPDSIQTKQLNMIPALWSGGQTIFEKFRPTQEISVVKGANFEVAV